MKTVSFDDEAYNLLRGAKLPGESFSDVVKRRFGGRRDAILATAGGWKDMSDAEAEALRQETRGTFEKRRR